jgi:hypothetical protein
MSNNVVLVTIDDLAKINKLVNVSNNQTCTYSNNVYILPNTIPDSTPLFFLGTGEGGSDDSAATATPNGTTIFSIDQWRAATSIANGTGTVTVNNDRIIKLPLSEILSIVSNLDL